MNSIESRTSAVEKEPTFNIGEVVFIPRSNNRISSAVIGGITDDSAVIVWEENGEQVKKRVPVQQLKKLSPELISSVYSEGVVINVPRGADGKRRSNIKIEGSSPVGEDKIMISWIENGQTSTRTFDIDKIQVASEEKPVANIGQAVAVKAESVAPVAEGGYERIDFHDVEQRNTYYNDVRELVEEAAAESKKVLQKKDEYTGSGEWPVYHKTGLQAATTARLFYRGNFTTQFNRLEKLLQPPSAEMQEKLAVLTPEELLAYQEAKELQIDALALQINTTYHLIQNQIDIVRDAVREADEALPQTSQEAVSAVAEPVENISMPASVAVEKINIVVEDVSGLPFKEQIEAYVTKIKEVSKEVNDRLAKFGPTQLDAEKRKKLVDTHDRLVRLSERLEERLHETDQNLLKRNVPKTINWVKEDLTAVQNLVAETDVAAQAAVVSESVENVSSPFVSTDELSYKTSSVDFRRSAGDPYSNKNLTFAEETPETDDTEEAARFNRANAIAVQSNENLPPLILTPDMHVSEQGPQVSRTEAESLLESSLAQFESVPAETLSLEQQNFIAELTRLKEDIRRRKVVRGVLERGEVGPGIAKEIANIEKADAQDFAKVAEVIKTFTEAVVAENTVAQPDVEKLSPLVLTSEMRIMPNGATVEDAVAIIDTALEQLTETADGSEKKKRGFFVAQIAAIRSRLAGRTALRRKQPAESSVTVSIDKANERDIVAVDALLTKLAPAEAVTTSVSPIAEVVTPVAESVSVAPEAVEPVPAAVEYLRSLPYLTPTERTTGQSMYENYLRWKEEGRSDADLERALSDIRAYADDLVEHPSSEQLQARIAALKADIARADMPGRNTETINTFIENLERIAAEESTESDQPRTIAAYKNLVAFISDDAERVRAETAAMPSAGRYETPAEVAARTESVSLGIGSPELVKAKNTYRDALLQTIKFQTLLKTNRAFADADRSEKFVQSADKAMRVARESYEMLLWTAQSQLRDPALVQPANEIVALEAELRGETNKRSRLKRVIGVLALGLGLFAAEEVADGTRKVETTSAPAPYTASEISVAPTLDVSKPIPPLTVVREGSVPSTESVAPQQSVQAFDLAYPTPPMPQGEASINLNNSVIEGVDPVPQAQADRWGSVQVESSSQTIETIPALTIHDFRNGEGLIKVGRGVTEVGALSVMEHVPAKQRESVIDLTVARIANNPTLQAELNVGVDRATGDVFIYAGRPLNMTAYERELAATAKAVGMYIEGGEKTGAVIPPRPATVEVTRVASSATEVIPQAAVEAAESVTLTDLNEYVQNFTGGPAALRDAVATWARDVVEGAYYVAPGSRLLSIFSQQEYVDPFKALGEKTVSEILNLQGNKNPLARSQALNEWRITGEGFAQWADRLEKFVRHYDVRGAGDLSLDAAAKLMYADAMLSKTTNTTL